MFNNASAQERHFLYLQSEHQQAFYIKTGGKVYSSSDAGFVIIPQLTAGNFTFTLGFPKNKWAAQNYQLEIGGRDLGFQLKKIDDSNWALYDLQTKELLSALAQPVSNAPYVTLINDEFTNVLAEVSNTPSIKEKKWEANVTTTSDSVKVKLNTSENIPTKANTDIGTNVAAIPPKIPETADSLVTSAVVATEQQQSNTATALTNEIEKTLDTQSDSGRVLKFIVTAEGRSEEVDVLIPIVPEQPKEKEQSKVDTVASVQEVKELIVPESPSTAIQSDTSKTVQQSVVQPVMVEQVTPTADTVSAKPEVNNVLASQDIVKVDTIKIKQEEPNLSSAVVSEAAAVTGLDVGCIMAEEKDWMAIRRVMVIEEKEENMLAVAVEKMGDKCYTAEQIGHLAPLFIIEENRFVFIEKSYEKCSDKGNYSKLRQLFTTEEMKDRFNKRFQP